MTFFQRPGFYRITKVWCFFRSFLSLFIRHIFPYLGKDLSSTCINLYQILYVNSKKQVLHYRYILMNYLKIKDMEISALLNLVDVKRICLKNSFCLTGECLHEIRYKEWETRKEEHQSLISSDNNKEKKEKSQKRKDGTPKRFIPSHLYKL